MNCKFCNKECKNNNSLRNHERCCKQNPEYDANKYICRFCGRGFALISRYHLHEECCKLNPNRIPCRTAWSKGLTVATDYRIQRLANHVKDYYTNHPGTFSGKKHSTDTKLKISEKMKGNSNNNPNKTGRGRKGWYKNFFCSSTYELAFVIYCLDNCIPIRRCVDRYRYVFEGKQHWYYPDFIINNTIIEIKGYWSEVVDAKTKSVTDRDIIVLYRKDLKHVFDYIADKYNKIVDKNIHELYEK